MKIAIIHDWLVINGGAERVLKCLLELYPDADLYSLIDYLPENQRSILCGRKAKTSFLQHPIFCAKKHYRKLLPLMPFAIEQFDLSTYDLVISSSYCVAKGVLTGPNQLHVCYCHSPMRYAWDHYHEYLRELHLTKSLLGLFVRWQLFRIRTWDVRSSNSVDYFISNSRFVARRVKKYYYRDSEIIPAPVDTSVFQLEENKDDYYVAAGRFVPFKRLDIVVEAFCHLPHKKLILIGDGPELSKINQIIYKYSAKNITLTGYLNAKQINQYLSRAQALIFPSEEDFGILPIEAQSCGTPVIAYGRGGALETIIGLNQQVEASGLFFYQQTAESIIAAIEEFEQKRNLFSARFIHNHAKQFSEINFKCKIKQIIEQQLLIHRQN